MVQCTEDTISIRNASILWPKGARCNFGNLGSPKGRNPYGDRVNVVQLSGRLTVGSFLIRREYSTGSRDKVVLELRSLTERISRNPTLVVDRNLYKLICNPYLLEIAYHNIRSNPGNMSPGIVPETLDGISWDVLEKLSDSLKDESFRFKPGRRVLLPKASGGERPLTVASPRDKIVQEAMRIVLNEIFEPTFVENSHGFRPGKSCHTALKHLLVSFKPSVWAIEGDIAKCFDTIDHQVLMSIIETKVLDRQFTKLIQKSLSAGYLQSNKIAHNIVGTPQGSIISPILSNIYLHLLDEFVLSLKESFDVGKRARNTAAYENLRYRMKRAKKKEDYLELVRLYKESRKTSVMDYRDGNYKRLSYVRYADDWVIGVRGSYEDTLELLKKVREFCRTTLKLDVSEKKTKITNLNKEKAVFLGTNVFRSKHVKHSRKSSSAKQRLNLQLQLHVSLDRIRDKLQTVSILKEGEPNHKFLWMPLRHEQIIHLYNSVLRGFLNYYSFVGNYSRLVGWLRWVIYVSAAKTLARKYNLSVTKVFKKFGPRLSIGGVSLINPSYRFRGHFAINANPVVVGLYAKHKSMANLSKALCSMCGSSYRVEMHHVRAMKDLNPKASALDNLMARTNRKQIPLCRVCHMKKHRGEI